MIRIFGQIESKLNQIIQAPLNHNITIFNEIIYPEWFGVCTYQVVDLVGPPLYNDNIVIQKAINSADIGGSLCLLGKFYRINEVVNIDVEGLRITGLGKYYSTDTPSNYLQPTTLNNQGVFKISRPGIRISDINFTGNISTNKGAGAIGFALKYEILDLNGIVIKDIDTGVNNCMFVDFNMAIMTRGANLKVTNCTFTACYIGIMADKPLKTPITNHSNDDVNAQTRSHVITRNRFHSIGSSSKDASLIGSACIKIWNDTGITSESNGNGENYIVRGYNNEITTNHADDCKTFFEGSLDRTKIDGNTILTSGGTAIKATTGNYGSISNNLIDGSHTWNGNKLFPETYNNSTSFPSGHGIHINNSNYLTINNNQISNKRFNGIYIEKSRNSSIQNNTIHNFNRHAFIKKSTLAPEVQDGSTYCGIRIEKSPTKQKNNIQNIVSNNIISIHHQKVEGKYGIYAGDGDDFEFIKDNFILPTRITTAPILID
ncbi:right-handed parallel beta-helix repeat-containing protein [Patiriisocius marinus]|uniref:right-handed parallel beta-helix repeat-containing protein n=1 Tax=Patiriisocius marinus TaxID=1397112 RepID=UPI00233011DB|nr:right-handed parallel beta-helix repeat-containing protein [Patiriisocius marinus]